MGARMVAGVGGRQEQSGRARCETAPSPQRGEGWGEWVLADHETPRRGNAPSPCLSPRGEEQSEPRPVTRAAANTNTARKAWQGASFGESYGKDGENPVLWKGTQ